ncbi:MAG: hypothetical protein LUG99_15745 [Lachnospiraceae bacterium]|nr:hypothetical protein [Lachnospiraceae bacterium]
MGDIWQWAGNNWDREYARMAWHSGIPDALEAGRELWNIGTTERAR